MSGLWDGRFLRWFDAYSNAGISSNVWEERMTKATYLRKRILHSALQMGTLHNFLYGKDADLSNIKITEGRAFVHMKDSLGLDKHVGEKLGVRIQIKK